MMEGRQLVRPLTRQLYAAIIMDEWPGLAACVDFGLDRGDNQKLYEALYYPIRAGEIKIEQLDSVLGDGPAITKLVNDCPSNPHKDIIFVTAWDTIFEED